MGARFILGFGIAFITCAGPALLSELVHPRMRGTLVSFFNPFWYLGSIIAAWTCFGTSHMAITNAWAWRIPSLLQGLIPCFVVPSIYFIPESPRWLIANGREDEATAILAKYHGEGNAEDPLVRTQLVEIKVAMQQATEGVTWRALFTQKQNRARVLIVMCMTLMARKSTRSPPFCLQADTSFSNKANARQNPQFGVCKMSSRTTSRRS
jgi:MFS family permease